MPQYKFLGSVEKTPAMQAVEQPVETASTPSTSGANTAPSSELGVDKASQRLLQACIASEPPVSAPLTSAFTPINLPTAQPNTPSPPPLPSPPTPPPPTRPFPISRHPTPYHPSRLVPIPVTLGAVVPRALCTLPPIDRRHQIQSEINVIEGHLDDYTNQARGKMGTEELYKVRATVGPLLERRDWLWRELRETYRGERGLGLTPEMEEKLKEKERRAEGRKRAAAERKVKRTEAGAGGREVKKRMVNRKKKGKEGGEAGS